jgi:hypothetical protein
LVAATVPLTSSKAFLALREYVESKYQPGAFQRVRDTLALRGMELDRVIKPNGWYPTQTYVTALDVARDLFGPPGFAEEYGYAAAEYEMHFFLRFLLRFTSPGWLLQKGADVWRRFHDTGTWQISGSDHKMRGVLDGFGIVHDGFCNLLTGWFRRACELTGAREVVVVHPECRARGAKSCVFEGAWK